MFNKVKGTISEKNGNINVIQVIYSGFFIEFMSPTTSDIASIDTMTTINLHHCLKDVNGTFNESWFGFNKKEEKDFFLKLISIKGIGEKTAIAIMSFYDPNEIISIVKNKDIKALSKVPKIGGKTAEKFLLDMDKLLDPVLISKFSACDAEGKTSITSFFVIEETASALRSLGVSKFEKSLQSIADNTIYEKSELLLKAFLKKTKD
jgi:Holliday junction DNA helicase RuvA